MLGVAWLAGLAGFVGGVLSSLATRLPPVAPRTASREALHAMVALGGGLLLAAVALVLVPQAMAGLAPLPLALAFLGGGATACALDAALQRSAGPWGQFMAMLMDFVPEAIALGAVFSQDPQLGLLLAAFIGAQNLPEGFNACRERVLAGSPARQALAGLLLASLLGPLSAGLGHLLLRDQPAITAGVMAFGAGAILYLVFQDIAPKSTMRRHWLPPLGAVLGFLVGMLAKQVMA